jgi:hypothetical protein
MFGSWFGAAPSREDEHDAPAAPRPAMRVTARPMGYRVELVVDCHEPEVRFCLPAPPALQRWSSIVTEFVMGWAECQRPGARMRLDHAPACMTWATDSTEAFTCTFRTHSTPEILYKQELEHESRDTLRLVALGGANAAPAGETARVDAARTRFLFAPHITGSVLSDGGGGQVRAVFYVKTTTLAIETL